MRGISRLSVVVLGFVLFAVDQATAQPLVYTAESLDSFIMNADRVWVARIIGVRDDPIPGGSKMPGVTIAIEETLKYPLFEQRHKKMGLFVEHPTTVFKGFEERSSRLLIAHSDQNQFSPKIIELAEGKTKVFLADFTMLRKPDTVVEAARKIIGRIPPNVQRLHTMRLMIPREVLLENELGPYGQLIVPVDDQLKDLAIGFLKSKSYSRRSEAAKILRYFKSDANIDRLRRLLKDSGYSQQVDGGTRSKYYGVREDAYRTLKAWGIEVERPVIVEPDNSPNE